MKPIIHTILVLFIVQLLLNTIGYASDTIPKDTNSIPVSSLRTTRIAFVGINSFVIPSREVSSIIAATTDTLVIATTVQSQIQEVELPLFKITLKNTSNSTEITNTYQGSSVLYTGLTEGNYTIIIQGFVPLQWQSEPVILNFVIDNKRAKDYLGSKPTAIDSLSDTSKLAISKYEKSKEESTAILIYLIVGSIVFSGIAIFIFMFFQRETKPKPKNVKPVLSKSITNSANSKNFPFSAILSMFKNFSLKRKEKNIPSFIVKSSLNGTNSNGSIETTKLLQTKVALLEQEISLLSKKTNELSKRNTDIHSTINKFDDQDEQLKVLQRQKESITSTYHSEEMWLPSDEEISFMMDLIEGYDLNALNQQGIAAEIKEVADSISKITRDITKVLMLETDRISLESRPNEIQEIIELTNKKYNKISLEKNVSIKFSALTHIPIFLFDSIKIEEAYDYLLNNAIKYTFDNTSVAVTAYIENKNVIVTITDQGPGLKKEDLYAAFTNGADKITKSTTDQQVKGVSLWVVKKLIDAHKGKIWVKSSVGNGATFSFSLPIE